MRWQLQASRTQDPRLPDSCEALPFNDPRHALDYRDNNRQKDWPAEVVGVQVVTKPGGFSRLLILPEVLPSQLYDRSLKQTQEK